MDPVEERREVDDAVAFFASIDPTGRLSLPERARLAPYAETIKVFLSGPASETAPASQT